MKIFNLVYLIAIFSEFYSDVFHVERKSRGRPLKFTTQELFTFVLWGKNNSNDSCSVFVIGVIILIRLVNIYWIFKKPSKTTLNNFVNENMELFDKFDQFLVDFASALRLIGGEILYGDGTILKAWCNTFKDIILYEIKYLKEFLTFNVSNKELWMKLKSILLK